MGRRRSVNFNLPPRMHRKGTSYYYVVNQKWTRLGGDIAVAKRKWAELEGVNSPSSAVLLFGDVAARYSDEVIPTKASRTQRDNRIELANLLKVFADAPLTAIRPMDIRGYLKVRGASAPVRANRERALFSHIFNWWQKEQDTNEPNPAAKVASFEERPRDVYVSDSEFKRLFQHGDQVLQDALELSLPIGQRPSDVLDLKFSDIENGELRFKQRKTGKWMRIKVVGQLKEYIDRIKARPQAVKGVSLVQTARGEQVTMAMLRKRFDRARKAAGLTFQWRDLRAKSASDADDIAHAQKLLGHKSQRQTEDYIRVRQGERVTPLNSRILEDIRSEKFGDPEGPP